MRYYTSLSGTWRFQIDPAGQVAPESLAPDREIPVPLPWQSAFPELAQYSGYAWYSRQIDVDEQWLQGKLLLRFGAVDYWCRVFVNGRPVGEHEGGYTPFEVAIEGYVQPGRNEIAVQVYDSVQAGINIDRWPAPQGPVETPGPPFNARDIPHGKQEWYINVGGIWQDVELVAVPSAYVDHVRITTDIHSGQAAVQVELAGEPVGSSGGTLRLKVEANGAEAGSATIDLKAGERSYEASVPIEDPRLWSPDDPYLYTLSATLQTGGSEDTFSTRFGFREISTANGQILLNGQPLFLLCALDQDLYPDTIYTVPSEEFLRDQFTKARHLGLNSLRCHIKPPDPLYLDLADEMGLLIWAEIPSWRTFNNKPLLFPERIAVGDEIKQRVERTLDEMIRRDFNHPSLIIWTIVNEDWGTSLPLSPEDRQWVGQMYHRCKELDPTRLVVDNSACPHPWGPNIHVHSDLDDFHIYANIPDQAKNFEQAIDQFGLRPLWTYSNYGDAARSGQEPLVLSEFGNWGLPSLKALRDHYGSDPGWFEIGAWWSPWEGESGWPKGADERFKRLGFDSIWGDYEEFATATQWHQFEAMKFEIGVMRRQPSLAGYVITEFTDAYWESNGLLDFARNPKAYYDCFASINSPDVIVARPDKFALWDDQRAEIQVYLAHYSASDWSGARLAWSIDDRAPAPEYKLPPLKRGGVMRMKRKLLRMPTLEETRDVEIKLVLRSEGGQVLAQNSLKILVMPAALREAGHEAPVGRIAVITDRTQAGEEVEAPPALPPGAVSGSDETALDAGPISEYESSQGGGTHIIEQALRKLGYEVAGHVNAETRVAVSNYPNARLLQWVREGGTLLFIADGASPFFWAQPRTGAYSGSWITSFSWLRDRVHRRLRVQNPIGLPFKRVMPRQTILGLPVEDPTFQNDFLSGMVSGWVRHPSLHTVQFKYGRGRVIMTTFAIENGLILGDAVAAAMLQDLLEYLCSDRCAPVLAANY